MHLNAVWQFGQIQTPKDGHIGPKHVVLSESEEVKKIKNCCIIYGIDMHKLLNFDDYGTQLHNQTRTY
jgi:hypothetical protein